MFTLSLFWLWTFIALLVTAVRGLMAGLVSDQLGRVLLSCAVLIAVLGMLTMRRYHRT